MKQTIVIVAIVMAAFLGATAYAQESTEDAVADPVKRKIGMVKIDVVFAKYERATAFLTEMERAAQPYRASKEELEKLIQKWITVLNNPNPKLTKERRETASKDIILARRKLEDLEIEFRKHICPRVEDEVGQIIKQINDTTRDYAAANGYAKILTVPHPEEFVLSLLPWRPQFTRIVFQPIAVPQGAENVSLAVVQILNGRYRDSQKKP